jgi:glycerate kinase
VIGLGGSASTDGGAGALAALGLAAQGGELRAGGLGSIVTLDRSRLLAPPEDVVLLSDVTNPLLGQNGAAAVYGPQKGARPDQVESLDAALARFSGLLGGDPAQPGAGAAGGTAYGFSTAWGATIEPGAAYLSTLTGLPDAVARADLLLTGEGRFDATSAEGKLVGQLIGLAGEHGVAAGVIAGQLAVPPVDADGEPLWAASLAELAGTTEAAMADPARWLRVAGAEAARAVPLAE